VSVQFNGRHFFAIGSAKDMTTSDLVILQGRRRQTKEGMSMSRRGREEGELDKPERPSRELRLSARIHGEERSPCAKIRRMESVELDRKGYGGRRPTL